MWKTILRKITGGSLTPTDELNYFLVQVHKTISENILSRNSIIKKVDNARVSMEITIFFWTHGRVILQKAVSAEIFESIESKFYERLCKEINYHWQFSYPDFHDLLENRLEFYGSKKLNVENLSTLWIHNQFQPYQATESSFLIKSNDQALEEFAIVQSVINALPTYKESMSKLIEKYKILL